MNLTLHLTLHDFLHRHRQKESIFIRFWMWTQRRKAWAFPQNSLPVSRRESSWALWFWRG